MSERTWGDIEKEIRDDYLRADGPENINFREVQWEVWLAEVVREAEARTIAKHSAVSLPDHADCLTRLADALEAVTRERDAALAAIERVRAAHRKFTYYDLEDSCPDTSEEHREERHHESDEIGEFYCEDMPTGDVVCDLCRDADGERMDWPCETIAALAGAPEPDDDPTEIREVK